MTTPSPEGDAITDEWEALLHNYLEDTLATEDCERLRQILLTEPAARERYFAAVKTDTLLCSIAGKQPATETAPHSEQGAPDSPLPGSFRRRAVAVSFLAAACIALLGAMVFFQFHNQPIAILAKSTDVRWLGVGPREGDPLIAGQELSVAAGQVEVHFDTGAITHLRGPAQFRLESQNSGFLHYGEAYTIADTERSKGFTIRTHSGRFIDRGTEFLTSVTPDGFSQMHVGSGAVDVEMSDFARQRLTAGSGIGVEPGEIPVMIQIEQGAADATFSFPTIPPPSAEDFANSRADGRDVTVTLLSTGETRRPGGIHPESGPPNLLLDGTGQQHADAPTESVFFDNGVEGQLLIDLGREVPVSMIRTYSWHHNKTEPKETLRAVQRYILWGATEGNPDTSPTGEDPAGWTRIARVDSDKFFRIDQGLTRPTQQACSIFSGGDRIGNFRYLLFQVSPTESRYDPQTLARLKRDHHLSRHTLFGEIDVFVAE